jgi:hypothetical protein
MKAHLLACPSCRRHVRTDEHQCPFCLSALPQSFGSGLLLAPLRAGLSRAERTRPAPRARAGALAGGVVVAAALASGCGGVETVDLGDGSVPPSCSGDTFVLVAPSACGLNCGSGGEMTGADYGAPPLEAEAYVLCDGHEFNKCTCTYPGPGWTEACPDGKPSVGGLCAPADAGSVDAGRRD